MVEFKVFNCLRSGAIQEVRNIKSTYAQNRTLLIQDPYNKKLWLLHGSKVNSETRRLSKFSLDELKEKTIDFAVSLFDSMYTNKKLHKETLNTLHGNANTGLPGKTTHDMRFFSEEKDIMKVIF